MVPIISTTILATLVSLFILLPGFVFLRAYWGDERGSLNAINFYSYLVWGTPASIAIYLLSIPLFNSIYKGSFPSEELWNFFISRNSSNTNLNSVISLSLDSFRNSIISSLLVIIFALIIGRLIRVILLKTRLDVTIPFFRFRSDWFYLFTRRDVVISNRKNYFIVCANLLCVIGDNYIIYEGQVVDYKFKDEILLYVYMSGVKRTLMKQEEGKIKIDNIGIHTPFNVEGSVGLLKLKASIKQDILSHQTPQGIDAKFYPIPNNDVMVFKAEEIKNINVFYQTARKPRIHKK